MPRYRRPRASSQQQQPSRREAVAATTMFLLSSTSRLGRASSSLSPRAAFAFVSNQQNFGSSAVSGRRDRRWQPITTTERTGTALGITDSRELRFFSGEGGTFSAASVFASSTSTFDAEELIAGLPVIRKGVRQRPRNDEEENGRSQASPSLFRAGMASIRSFSTSTSAELGEQQQPPFSGPTIDLTDEERELFKLLTQVVKSSDMKTTLRVAGGWVRDKLLATEEFQHFLRPSYSASGEGENDRRQPGEIARLTSKFLSKSRGGPSMGRQGTKVIGSSSQHTTSLLEKSAPVDIDIALDDMLGREFADHLNEWLSEHGRSTISVGVVLKNPEKSKHLETATMKVGSFWIDFVNLRAEEYTEDSRIPDLMRIGTADEDAHRRDLTINALFYNINTGRVEDMTGRGFDDLRKGVVATPLPPLTTLLDDPLRVLRSIRFAARLRFVMDEQLRKAACDDRVRVALAQKVARERIGGEVDLMLRSPDPVGAMRLLINLNLVDTVFPIDKEVPNEEDRADIFSRGLVLLSTTHDHLVECKISPPVWCAKSWSRDSAATFGAAEQILLDDEEARRYLWYASFLKPLIDHSKAYGKAGGGVNGAKGARSQGRKANRSALTRLMVDELKRPSRDAEAVEKITKAADDFTRLIASGCDLSASAVLLGELRVWYDVGELTGDSGEDATCEVDGSEKASGDCEGARIRCSMLSTDGTREIDPVREEDPVWLHAMEFRLLVSKVLTRVGPLWRAALILSLSEQLAKLNDDELSYTIEGDFMEHDFEEVRRGVIEQYDAFAASLLQLGLMGTWSQKPLIDGGEMKKTVLQKIPKGPVFRDVMDEQVSWIITHPGGPKDALIDHMRETYPEFV